MTKWIPDNRLVAGELERRWNERLARVRALEGQLAHHDTDEVSFAYPAVLTDFIPLRA
jgi:hypothetical protein